VRRRLPTTSMQRFLTIVGISSLVLLGTSDRHGVFRHPLSALEESAPTISKAISTGDYVDRHSSGSLYGNVLDGMGRIPEDFDHTGRGCPDQGHCAHVAMDLRVSERCRDGHALRRGLHAVKITIRSLRC